MLLLWCCVRWLGWLVDFRLELSCERREGRVFTRVERSALVVFGVRSRMRRSGSAEV